MPPPKEGWQRSRVVALFAPTKRRRARRRNCCRLQDLLRGLRRCGRASVAEQDWVRLTQSQFDPVEITPTFWIVPSWHEPPAAARVR
jgi:ribosomal protein L11 methyltransferase